MKRALPLLFSIICLFTLLNGCSLQSELLEAAKIETLAVTGGSSTVVLKADSIDEFVSTINSSGATIVNATSQELPSAQFTATCYLAGQPTATLIAYSEEFLQIDTKLYKGNFADLLDFFGQRLYSDTKEKLSEIFLTKAEDVQEISLIHHGDGNYKVVVDTPTIQSVLTALDQLTLSDQTSDANLQPMITVTVYLKGQAEPLEPLVLSAAENGIQILSSGGKLCFVEESTALAQIYSSIKYNPMPIAH